MKTGLLWYDNSKRSIDQRVADGVAYYKGKYGAVPTRCYINSAMQGSGDGLKVGVVDVLPISTVLLNHFWIGVEE